MTTKVRFLGSILFMAMISPNVFAGFLAENAIIVGISNTTSNSNEFAVSVIDGTGPCNSVHFASTDPVIQDRAYQAALIAFTEGYRVSFYDYSGNDCNNASHIRMGK